MTDGGARRSARINHLPVRRAACTQLRVTKPKGPRDWKNSRSPSGIEIFKRDWKFQASLLPNPLFFVENSEGQDFHFLLQSPRTPEGSFEGFEKGVSEGVSEGFSKGFSRVLEGSSSDPF